MCVVKPGMCSYKHSPRLHHKLAPGFYICPCLGRVGALIYVSPTVYADTAAASPWFESIRDISTSLATMNRLIMASNDESLDNSSPQDIESVICLEDVYTAGNSKTPCKRVKLVDIEDVDPQDNGNSPTTARWRTTEKELSSVTNRLLTMEGAIGVPEPVVNAASLWSGVQESDTRLTTLEGRLGKTLDDKLLLLQRDVNGANGMAGGAAKKVRGLEADQRLSVNSSDKAYLDHAHSICAQLARENKLLRVGLEDVSNFLVGVVDGRIPIAGPPQHALNPPSPATPAVMVPCAVFDTHVAEQKRELALLNQQISGGGYTIMGQTFVIPEDSFAFAAQNFH